ncbi:recombination protein U [Lapidilactobacillus dextrinicus DSM 20335]|uniref:Holliday junction resolvase RecU n=1 Tax=Lapidilactobacillus dextrinicus DSM 20335 TaxID=1423738 RepID=A0A0R2BU54_9LACO|nr:Holliday junction resolvase RecU [Lapidilactobacillus dextrinicus]KRM79260.1 recombination protein U [Lapidilactobacillus dextrinicus DSM 20335]QFG46899.1 Holliday junction resolvase RecU [Lapidilactobacillus dextrinicus]
MTIKYPDGRYYQGNTDTNQSNTKLHHRDNVIFGGRGMSLEETINDSNVYYRSQDRAVIYKKPTPIRIVKVDYPKRSKATIKEAYFQQASTTDYNGVYRGYYLDFEAKETTNKASFPLKNFHQHQVDHFKRCLAQQGICFTIMRFSSLERYFVTPASLLIDYWQLQETNRKSIPLKVIETQGYEIQAGFHPALDYLKAVDQLIQHSTQTNSKGGKI